MYVQDTSEVKYTWRGLVGIPWYVAEGKILECKYTSRHCRMCNEEREDESIQQF